ncbi:MAG: methyltransferase [Thermomicrobiales bacterium]
MTISGQASDPDADLVTVAVPDPRPGSPAGPLADAVTDAAAGDAAGAAGAVLAGTITLVIEDGDGVPGFDGPLVRETVRLPRAGRDLDILRPDDTDALLDRAADDPEQNLPYWAEIWPSGIALADALLTSDPIASSTRTVEIGSGLGITAAAALLAGADLLCLDYFPDSLALCRRNARQNAGREPDTLAMNWRHPDEAFWDLAGDGFPLVLAADVLYEGRDVVPLADLVDRLLAPGGLFFLAHPGRPPALRFLELLGRRGWQDIPTTHAGPWPDPKDEDVVVSSHRLHRRGG